jgi:hypothetical protein
MPLSDLSLLPSTLITSPGPEFADDHRQWQGIPGIERAANGQLWATWYSGAEGEGPGNIIVLVTSADDGRSWSAPRLVVQPPDFSCRCYDPCLWCDPLRRLWLFWAQSADFFDGRAGVWAARCADPQSDNPTWDSPRRLCNGVMMNKPIVLSSGEWCLPAAVWAFMQPHRPDLMVADQLAGERFSNLVISTDNGETWTRRGGADVPQRAFDEHMVVERGDGSLWMLVRRKDGIGEAVSTDRGISWRINPQVVIPGPSARFFLRRLSSGRLLLIYHAHPHTRCNLTARLSEDDGRTWSDGLLIDERPGVSYPDAVESPDGRLYIIYDYNRGDRYALGRDRQILLAVVIEADILAGRLLSSASRLRNLVNQERG